MSERIFIDSDVILDVALARQLLFRQVKLF